MDGTMARSSAAAVARKTPAHLVDASWSEKWRADFRGALKSYLDPDALHSDLVRGIQDRTWTRLRDEQGRAFRTFESFCSAPEPWGLGSEPEIIRRFLDDLLGPRRTRLLLVRPGQQGERIDLTSRPQGERSPGTRQDERLRAIVERAPKIVHDLHCGGYLTAKEAERFGRERQSPAMRKAISKFCKAGEKILKKNEPVEKVRPELRKRVREIFDDSQSDLIYSARVGQNAELLADALAIHILRGSTVADVTYGRGSFWKLITEGAYNVVTSDLMDGVDGRHLPYESGSIDAVLVDPPYQYISSGGSTTGGADLEQRYRNHARAGVGHESVVQLYVDLGREAARVLRPKGVVMVKCQDEVASGRQRLTHVDVIEAYRNFGFECDDLFVLVQTGRPMVNSRVKRQRHARKNHSYLLVFKRRRGVGRRSVASAPGRNLGEITSGAQIDALVGVSTGMARSKTARGRKRTRTQTKNSRAGPTAEEIWALCDQALAVKLQQAPEVERKQVLPFFQSLVGWARDGGRHSPARIAEIAERFESAQQVVTLLAGQQGEPVETKRHDWPTVFRTSGTQIVDQFSRPDPYKIIEAAELEEFDGERFWLIDGLWPRNGVGMKGGPPKAVKTWSALDMALSVASGTPCLEKFTVRDPGPVVRVQRTASRSASAQRVDVMAWSPAPSTTARNGLAASRC